MDWLITAAGALLVLAILRDVFHTLLHTSGEGSLSRGVVAAVWRAAHALEGRRPLDLAGPLGFVAVAATWTGVVLVGFALVFWPHLDDSFTVASNLEPDANQGFLDALYFSGVTGATLGYGDLAAATPGWRLVAVFEGVVGLALLTALVSWLLSLYAALERRRSLAGTVFALGDGSPPSDTMVESLASALQSVRTDLTQHSAVYYFHAREISLELPAALPALAELAADAPRGDTLSASLDALARKLREFVEAEEDTGATFLAYARDHRVEEEAELLRLRVAERRR